MVNSGGFELGADMLVSRQNAYPFLTILAGHVLIALFVTCAVVWMSLSSFGLSASALAWSCAAILLPVAACEPARRNTAPPSFGAANRITLARGCLVAWVAAFVASEGTTHQATWVASAASLALVMDGLDGFIARRTQSESEYGGQFDMEFDSVLMLVLCWLAFAWDQAGLWVLFCGLARYIWIAVGSQFDWFRRPLPPAFRRKTACVVGVIGLIGAVSPLPGAVFWAAAATATLALSFGIDAVWLVRHRKDELS